MDGHIDELDILIEAEAGKAVKELNALMKTLKDVRSVLAGATKQEGDLGEKKAKKAQSTYEDFIKTIKNIGKINVDSSDIKKVKGTISLLESSLSKLQDKNLKNISLGVDENSKSFRGNIYEIIKTNNLLDSYKSKLAEIQALSSANRPKNYWEVPEKVKQLRETGSTENPTINTPDVEEINEVSDGLGYINQEITNIGNNGGFENAQKWIDNYVKETFGATDATDQFKTAIERLKFELKGMGSEGLTFGDKAYDGIYQELQSAIIEEKEQRKYLEELAKISNQALSGEGNAAKLTASEMEKLAKKKAKASVSNKELADRAKKTGKSLDEEGRSAKETKDKLKQFVNVMQSFKKAFNGVDRTIKSFGRGVKRAFAPVGHAIGDATKRLLGFKKEAGKKTSIGRMIGMSVLYSTMFQTISLIKKAISEGSQNLAQYSAEYNKSISSIMSALLQLKNAFSVAFAPIINVVAPYLTAFINMVSKALNVVGQFFAALTGKSYATQAVKVYGDYAAGLDKTGSGADKANKSIKDLKRTIMGFDELNVLTDNSDSASDSGTGGTGAIGDINPADMFTDVPIAKNISDFAKKLRAAIKKEDWYGLGKIMADEFNKGMQKFYDAINWKKVGPKITYFVNAFTSTMNSLVENINWDLMGRTVGAGINTIIKTLNLLIDGFNWKQLGAKFATGVNGIFTEVDFTGIGNFIGGKFMIIWNILNGFFNGNGEDKGLNYALMGKKFGDGINGIFQKVDFTTIAQTLSGGLNGLAQIIQNFVLTVKWDEIAKNLYDGINYFIHNTNWAELGKSLSDLVTSLLGTIRTAVDNTDWHAIGKAIGDFLGSIDWKTIIGDVGHIIWEAFSGVISGLFDTDSGKVIIGFGVGLLTLKAVFGGFTIASEISKIMLPLMEMSPSFAGVVTSIGGSVVKLASMFGLKGLLVVGIALAAYEIYKHWDDICAAAENLYESVAGWWNETKKNTKETWDSICEQTSSAWDDLKKWSSEKFESIHESVSGWWSETKKNTKGTWESVKEQVGGTWDNIKTKADDKFGGIADTIKSAWDKTQRNTSSDWGLIGKILSGNWEDMGRDASKSVSEIAKEFKNLPGEISKKLGGLWNIGRDAIKNFADGFSNFHIPVPHIGFSWRDWEIGGVSFSVPKFNLSWHRNGGFVNGEVWGMNESGNPEMVGRVGNKTAVANNAIIAEAIEGAVVNGMTKVFGNTQSSEKGNEIPEINIYLGNRKITDAIIEEVTKRIKSTGKVPFPV